MKNAVLGFNCKVPRKKGTGGSCVYAGLPGLSLRASVCRSPTHPCLN